MSHGRLAEPARSAMVAGQFSASAIRAEGSALPGTRVGSKSRTGSVVIRGLSAEIRHFPPASRRQAMLKGSVAAFLALCGCCAPAWALDKVTFGLNWFADPEAGGYYQAQADGTYAKYGLDVTIMQGGPQTNGGLLLLVGKIQFYLGGDLIGDFVTADRKLPTIVVAADFQKDPLCFMSHPGVGLERWTDLPNADTAFVSEGGLTSYYAWMVAVWGFHADKVRPYDFNSAPFIADKHSIQEAYVTSEPYQVERLGGFKPNIFLLYDYGLRSYASTIDTRVDLVEKNPDLVQRFVDASAIGWYHYLYGDSSKGNAAIKHENPLITDGQITYSLAKLKQYGIVDSGDALTRGIGAMSDERMADFFAELVKARLVKPGADYKRTYTLRFVNKGVGVELGPH
jgi:NitT/TauT family transport system substrate-binding protein